MSHHRLTKQIREAIAHNIGKARREHPVYGNDYDAWLEVNGITAESIAAGWEDGKVCPSDPELEEIAENLGVSADYLRRPKWQAEYSFEKFAALPPSPSMERRKIPLPDPEPDSREIEYEFRKVKRIVIDLEPRQGTRVMVTALHQ